MQKLSKSTNELNQSKRKRSGILSTHAFLLLTTVVITLFLAGCGGRSGAERINFGTGQEMHSLVPLSVHDDAIFVLFSTVEWQGDDYRDIFHIGWMHTDETDFRILRTLAREGWTSDDEMEQFIHEELLTQVAKRPCGGMLALILEEEMFIDWADVYMSTERFETHLVFYAADGTIEHEITISDLLPEEFGGWIIGNSMQVLSDGRIVINDEHGNLLVLSSGGEIEQIFEAGLESFVILHDERMIATLFDIETWEWNTRYFDLEMGQIVESSYDVVPAAYRSPIMIPGIRYDIYSPIGDNMYGIDLATGRAERLFSWTTAAGSFHEFVLSDMGVFYYFVAQGEQGEGFEGFRLGRIMASEDI